MFWLKLIMLSSWLLGQMPQDSGISVTSSEAVNEFKLNNGDIMRGEIASMNEEGLVINRKIGGFSDRVPWTRFTQETLKKLAKNPRAREYVEPFIEIPIAMKPKRVVRKREFHAKEVPRVELPAAKADFIAAVTAPFNLGALALLFAANIFAAYEIAAFRNRPPALVCGLSVILPFLSPIVFLSLPRREDVTEAEAPEDGAAADASPAAHQISTHPLAQSSLTTAKVDKSHGTTAAQPMLFTRGDTTFNRRFFETKFPGFFRVVPSEAEKDMVIVIKTGRDEIIASRIARITATDMHLASAFDKSKEVSVGFGDISQVQLRHKDAKAK